MSVVEEKRKAALDFASLIVSLDNVEERAKMRDIQVLEETIGIMEKEKEIETVEKEFDIDLSDLKSRLSLIKEGIAERDWRKVNTFARDLMGVPLTILWKEYEYSEHKLSP